MIPYMSKFTSAARLTTSGIQSECFFLMPYYFFYKMFILQKLYKSKKIF